MARIRSLVNQWFPVGATLEEVLEVVARRRGHPVMVRDTDLGHGTSGAWVRTATADWIFVNATRHERRLHVIGHEIGHILLGHHDHVARSHYEDPDERAAELFGTHLVQRMRSARLGSASNALR